MFALTKKVDYALIAMAHLAKHTGSVVSAREIADRYGVPLPILTNILKRLNRADLVNSERGPTGGYGLARGAETINLDELIGVIEGPFELVRCVAARKTPTDSRCDLESSCPIRLPVSRIHQRLKVFLQDVTLAELVEGNGSLVSAGKTSLATAPPES